MKRRELFKMLTWGRVGELIKGTCSQRSSWKNRNKKFQTLKEHTSREGNVS
jgi:hypothetical protein